MNNTKNKYLNPDALKVNFGLARARPKPKTQSPNVDRSPKI